MPHRIHVFGASGSGTTTLGARLASAIGGQHLDTDSYYWHPTDPPFTTKRPIDERIALIRDDSLKTTDWTLSGSLCSWGDPLLGDFSLAVFLHLEQSLRLDRLRARELRRYGDRILLGGDMYEQHREFMEWAKSYDTARSPIRSRDMHERWMTTLSCPVIRLDSSASTEVMTEEILAKLA